MAKNKTKFYKIRNWHKYQHYKNRNPTWIKLHTELLTSKDWVCLDDCDRVLVISCMLIAAHNGVDGVFPADHLYIKRVAYLNQEPNFEKLIENGFIEEVERAENKPSILPPSLTPIKSLRPLPFKNDIDFDYFWDLYPERSGGSNKLLAYREWQKRIKEGEKTKTLIEATKRYHAYCEATNKIKTEFVLDAKNFLGQAKEYLRTWEITKNERATKNNSTSSVIESLNNKFQSTINPTAKDANVVCENERDLDAKMDE